MEDEIARPMEKFVETVGKETTLRRYATEEHDKDGQCIKSKLVMRTQD